MAEAVVGQVVIKLGAALAKDVLTFGAKLLWKEASALKGLFGRIRASKAELESMQAYLQEAERFKDTDMTTAIFVGEIRGLAFQIEDVVDEFTYKLEEVKHKGGFVAKINKRLRHIKTWYRLAAKLHEIEGKLQDAKRKKNDYSVGRFASAARFTNQALQFTRDEDLVGIKENRDKLIRWLTGDGGGGDDLELRSSKVTTVWGMPGVGKTTLVAHVYNTVKVDFDTAAWVTVSESYRLEDLLKNIAAKLGIAVDAANTEMRGLAQSIHNYLQGKKCILVLDDVWNARLWSEIRDLFPTSNCTSRCVITSRKQDVWLATRQSAIHLEPLQEHDSWLLFCKGAFWNDDDKECPLELQKLALKFTAKCQGLPIALACIGRLLSCKPPTSAEWEDVYRGLDSQLAKDVIPDVDMILKVSLEDLPHDLKNCFLLCALFPEDYVLQRRMTMRQWIAAGFIREKEKKTLEEVAEGYLTELVNRSLLQVVKRNHFGRLKHCRMHDVIRLLALNKAKEECFGEVYNVSAAGAFSVEGARRISIQGKNLEQLSQSGATHLRALHVFDLHSNVDSLKPILTSSNLLSTLDLQGSRIKMLPGEVFDLFNLRYLGLRYTQIKRLPEAVGRLQNLEVLDAYYTKLTYLPNSVVKLKKLRNLYAFSNPTAMEEVQFENLRGIKVPNGIQILAGLHALLWVESSPEFLREVAALTELRTFGVFNVCSEDSADLSNALTKMSHLVHLGICAATENEVLRLEGLHLPPTLSILDLGGRLEKTSMPQLFSSWSHLDSLTKLSLQLSNIDQGAFSCLCVLRGLRSLDLVKAFEGKRLDIYAGSFPKLQFLHIGGAEQLNQIGIEKGAMQNLAELSFAVCPKLEFLPDGIEHLGALEKLLLQDPSEELIEKLRQLRHSDECSENLMKISHIRNVTVVQKGQSKRIK